MIAVVITLAIVILYLFIRMRLDRQDVSGFLWENDRMDLALQSVRFDLRVREVELQRLEKVLAEYKKKERT